MGHREIVVFDKAFNLVCQMGHRSEAASTQEFSLEHSEDDLDLIEPRTMFWQVDEVDAVAGIREELAPCALGLQDSVNPFFPRSSVTSHCSATHFTRLSDTCVFRLSTTKFQLAVGSELTVRAMC